MEKLLKQDFSGRDILPLSRRLSTTNIFGTRSPLNCANSPVYFHLNNGMNKCGKTIDTVSSDTNGTCLLCNKTVSEI